jgi:branched-chain amino acid transport system permease protein
LGLGLTIIASVALLPRGLVGVPGQWKERLVGRSSRRAEMLEVQDERA